MEGVDTRPRDDSASILLANQNNLKQQPTLSGYIPSTMAPVDIHPSLQNGQGDATTAAATATAPLTESALLQLQIAQAEQAQQQSLQHLETLREEARSRPTTEYSPPVQSPIPPGSPAGTVSSAGGGGVFGGGGGEVGGINSSNSLQSPFAFASVQQQHQFTSRDISGGSHLTQPGEDCWGAVSPRSVQSGTSSAAAVGGAAGGGCGRETGCPVSSPQLQPAGLAAAPAAASSAAVQWQQAQQQLLAQQQQQLSQNMFNSISSVVPGYHVASSLWSGVQHQASPQQQALADAAVSAQLVANQKVLEQQQAAAVASQAASTVAATNPTDLAHRAQAALNAVQAQSVYEIASQDAINAQSRATQLQQAALTASLQPTGAATSATAALAATLPQIPSATTAAAQVLSAAVIPPSPMVPVAAVTPQSSHLVQAAVAAKQNAAQKQLESQAAASAYQTAAVQAASAIEPSHVAVANAVAQQAAVIYQTAANEAASAAVTAAHLEQAVATAAASAAAAAAPAPALIPASVPLAAQIAAGATLQQTQPLSTATLLAAQQQQQQQQQQAAAGFGVLPSPALTAALASPTIPAAPPVATTAAAPVGAPSASSAAAAVAAAQQHLHQMQLIQQATTGMQQSGLYVTPTAVLAPPPPPSSVLGMSLADTIATNSLSSGMQSLNIMSEPQYPSIPIPTQAVPSALHMAPPVVAAAASPPLQQQQQQQQQFPSPPSVVKAVCSSGGSFIRGTGSSWDYEGGETRLVNIPYGCSAETLFATLERATSSLSESTELSSEYNPTLKYRLPSDPSVWVDLVDDDDVELMFDEWQDACMMANQASGGSGAGGTGGSGAGAGGRINSPTYAGSVASAGSQATSSSCKLHIFVQWRRPISSLGSSSVDEAVAVATGGGGGGGGGESVESGGGTETAGSPVTSTTTPDANNNNAAAAASGSGGTIAAMQSEIQVVTPADQNEETDANASPFASASAAGNKDNSSSIIKSGSTTATAASTRRHNRQRRVKNNNNNNNNAAGSSAKNASHHHSHSISIDLPDLVERMEIIQPSDISLVKFLGSGGYGDVYLGRWHGCEVAVKCLNPALFFQGGGVGGEPGAINRAAVTDLIKEADMLGSLRHPNVVWVYGMVLPVSKCTNNKNDDGDHDTFTGSDESGSDGDGDGVSHKKQRQRNIIDVIQAEAGAPSMMPGILRPPALVTEYMAGGSLKTALSRKADIVAGPLTRIVLALDAAKGVEYLHSKRLVHFDLKSGNLLLGYRDRRPICKVADFGLAREKAQTFVSGVTSQRGTLPWIAPEILRTPDAVTEAADVYSFAIVMWELWTGREPWENTNFHALMLQLANPELKLRPPIPGTDEWDGLEGSAPPELAPGWRNLMERCWEEDPNNRPPFTQIVKELRGMISAIRPPRGGRGEGIGGGNGTGVPAPR